MEIQMLDLCDICGNDHATELCPELGLNTSHVQLDLLSTRARLTLPKYLEVVDNGDGLVGVVALGIIPAKTQFGPYEARRTTHIFDDTGFFTLKLIAKDGSTVCLDTTDETECNWLCLMRAAVSDESKNCIAYQLGSNIFYSTTKEINPGEELQVWYAPHFGTKLGKPSFPDGQTRVLLGHRIEPLNSEIVADADGTGNQQTESGNTDLSKDGSDRDHVQASDTHEMLRGEIRKAFYCPRCGNTFASQTDMVQHLREHVIGGNGKPVNGKRGRGRPRIIRSQIDYSCTPKRGRGRPRKSQTTQVGIDLDGKNENQRDLLAIPVKTYIMKRKRKDSNDDNAEEEFEIEETDEEEEVDDENVPSEKRVKIEDYDDDDLDTDYTPVKEVIAAPVRVQPRRSNRGKHSKFDEDYVVGKIGKKIKQKSLNTSENEADESKSSSDIVKTSNDPSFGIQKGRGRPRKDKSVIGVSEDISGADVKTVTTTGSDAIVENVRLGTDKININGFIISNSATALAVQTKHEHSCKEENEKMENPGIDELESNFDDANFDNKTEPNLTDGTNLIISDSVTAIDKIDVKHDVYKDKLSPEKSDDPGISENFTDNDTKLDMNVAVGEEDDGKMMVMFEAAENDMVSCVLCGEKFHQEIDAISHFMSHRKGSTTCKTCHKELKTAEELKTHFEKSNCNTHDITHFKTIALSEYNGGEPIKTVEKVETMAEDHSMTDKQNIESNDEEQQKDLQHNDDDLDELVKSFKSKEPEGETFVCDICQQAFKSAQYLYRHMVMHTDVFNCVQCKKTFSRKDSLQKHVLKCCPHLASTYKIHWCTLCFRVFSTQSGKEKHLKKCKSVQCQECKKVFSSSEDVKSHICKKSDGDYDDTTVGKYSCGICPKSFQSLYYLKQHRVLHDGLHMCDKCGKSLPSADELEEHKTLCQTLETIKLLGIGKCEKCEEEFKNAKSFREHYLAHSHPYQCDKCNRRFVKIGTLSSHECQQSMEEIFACEVCSRIFKNQINLDRHTKDHGCMKYLCSVCGKQFHMKAQANEHVCEEGGDLKSNIIQAGAVSYRCSACSQQFSLKSAALEHTCEGNEETRVIQIVEAKDIHICSTCGKSFSTRGNLTKHMLLHGEKQFVCPHCHKRFHLEVYLKDHITCVHYKIYKYQCTDCGKMLKSKTGLLAHTRLFHSENKEAFPCQKCGKIFRQKGNLRTHMYSHSDERKFACDVPMCHRLYKYPDQLSRHKLEHKCINKLQCPECDKQFVRGFELKRHMQIYHSGLIYECKICSSRCGHRHTVQRHYKRKHPEEFPLLSQEGYIDSLRKHVKDSYQSIEQKFAQNEVNIENAETVQRIGNGENVQQVQQLVNMENTQHVQQIVNIETTDQTQQIVNIENTDLVQAMDCSEMLPRDAAEALHSLAMGTVTTKQYQLLHEKGLFKNDPSHTNDQNNVQHVSLINNQAVIVPQNTGMLQGQEGLQQTVAEGASNISAVSVDGGAIGMIQNADGTFSINDLQGIPQTLNALEGSEGQIVILQIVDPDSQEQLAVQGEGVQQYLEGEIISQALQQAVSDILQTGQTVSQSDHSLEVMDNVQNITDADTERSSQREVQQTEHMQQQMHPVPEQQVDHVILQQVNHETQQQMHPVPEQQVDHVILQQVNHETQQQMHPVPEQQVDHVTQQQVDHMTQQQVDHVILQQVDHVTQQQTDYVEAVPTIDNEVQQIEYNIQQEESEIDKSENVVESTRSGIIQTESTIQQVYTFPQAVEYVSSSDSHQVIQHIDSAVQIDNVVHQIEHAMEQTVEIIPETDHVLDKTAEVILTVDMQE